MQYPGKDTKRLQEGQQRGKQAQTPATETVVQEGREKIMTQRD